jgi:hypothetical protein
LKKAAEPLWQQLITAYRGVNDNDKNASRCQLRVVN